MKKNLGFSSFEFYFVALVIGLILIVGIHRYNKLIEETQQLSVEILAQNFSAAVYSYRARWVLAQQTAQIPNQLLIDKLLIDFSYDGWPLAIGVGEVAAQKVSVTTCLSLWNGFLQNPPTISSVLEQPSEKPSGKPPQYRLTVIDNNRCHYELVQPEPKGFYFEYSPASGQVKSFPSSIAKNS